MVGWGGRTTMVAADPFILTVTGSVAVEAAFMVPVSGVALLVFLFHAATHRALSRVSASCLF